MDYLDNFSWNDPVYFVQQPHHARARVTGLHFKSGDASWSDLTLVVLARDYLVSDLAEYLRE